MLEANQVRLIALDIVLIPLVLELERETELRTYTRIRFEGYRTIKLVHDLVCDHEAEPNAFGV